jgi:hypothetical protein
MNKILRYKEYEKSLDIFEDFVENLTNPKINEGLIDKETINKILKQLASDLKFNYSLIFSFGTGISSMYPIVEHLIKNSNLNVELTTENIVLLTITAIAIAYLEENKNKTGDSNVLCNICSGKGCKDCDEVGMVKSVVTKEDARTLLEELKLRGFGNGIVKKVVKCFISIGHFLKMIFKNTPLIISSFLDLFGYTAVLIPTMNAIHLLIDTNNWNIETLPTIIGQNLISFGVGISAMLARRGFDNLANKIKDFINSLYKKPINNKMISNDDEMINEQ